MRGRGSDHTKLSRTALAVAIVAFTLPWLLATHPAPAGADSANDVQACPTGATNDQFNCMRYPYPIQKVTAELMPDGTFSWVAGSDNTTLPTCPNFVQPADVPCQQFGPNQVRVFEGASSPTKVLPLVPGTGQVSLYGAGYSGQFEWAGKACGTFECRYWVRPNGTTFADGQDRVLMMEYQTYIRATYDSSGITSTYRNLLVTVPRGLTDPVANATYSATGTQGEWRLDASTSSAASPASITDYEWTIPGVGTKHGAVTNAVIPRAQLPANVTLKVTDSSALSTTTTITVDDSIAIQTVDLAPASPVVGADPAVATVTVKNQGAWPVTGATASITSATPDLITVASGPTPASRTLNPGASGTFTIPLDAVARGQATIKTSASAVDGTRTLTDGPKDRILTVKAPALQAVLEADPGARTAGKPFALRATVTNTGDTTLTNVVPDGATGASAGTAADELLITGPTPAAIASLAPDASATFTYQVTSPPGTLQLSFRAKATDPDAGPITSNTARLEKQVVEGLRISSVTGANSGKDYGTAKGGEVITLRGAGFTDVTQVVLDDGTDESIVEAVFPEGDDTITFSSPDVADRLEQIQGADRYLVDVIARYEDPDHPGQYIESAPQPYAFQGPIITAIIGERSGEDNIAGARGGETLSINGSGFTDVTSVAMFTAGTDDQTVTIDDVDIVSDELMTITSPDVTPLLERGEDGVLRYDVDVLTGYEADSIGGQIVQSNAWPFAFVGPSITSITAERSGRDIGAIKGGETLTVKGYDLDDVTSLWFRQAGVPDEDVLATAEVTVVDPNTLTVSSPNLAEHVSYDPETGVGGVNTEVYATVEPSVGESYASNALRFDFQGPSITAIHGERDGGATIPVGGGTFSIEGTGLTDVTELAVYRTGTDDLLTTLEVTDATETSMTVESPNLGEFLLPQDDGLSRVKADLVARIPSVGAPEGAVLSPDLRADFTPPQLLGVIGDRSGSTADTAKGGVNTLTLTGAFLKDVDRVLLYETGTSELLNAIPVDPEDDTTLVLDSPSMTDFLKEHDDDQTRVETDVVLVDDDAETERGEVFSQPQRFDFLAPHIESIGTGRGTGERGPVSGGDTWTFEGTGFTDVTEVSLYRAGTDVLLASVPVAPSSDTSFEITSPRMDEFLLPQSDELDRVKLDIRATYDDPDAANGVVRSNLSRYDLTPPSIDGLSDGRYRTDGTLDLAVEGDFFDDVRVAGYRDPADAGRLVPIPFTVADDSALSLAVPPLGRLMTRQPDGSWAADIELFVGYTSDAATEGVVLSNPGILQLRADALTQVSQASSAGDTEIEVASNDGWQAGQYALIEAPGGAIVRRVAGIGSLIFDAPVPVDLPVGTVIRQIDPPQGDTTPPAVASLGTHEVQVGQTASVTFVCADGDGVGVEACAGSIPDGTAIDTSKPGTTTVAVTAWDRNGNATRTTFTWTVTAGPATTTTSTTTAISPSTTTTSPGAGATTVPGGGTSATPSGSLARTGSSSGSAVQAGLLLLIAGSVLLVGSRRLRRA